MNSSQPDPWLSEGADDWLDALLRESLPAAIADDGFSARVMQHLAMQLGGAPAHSELKRSKQPKRYFEWFSLIGAVLGSAIAAWGSTWPSPDAISASVNALVTLRPVAIDPLMPWLASLCSAAVLAYVMHQA